MSFLFWIRIDSVSVNGVDELDEKVIGDADKNVVGEVDDNVDENVERDPLNKSAVDLFNAAAAVNELPAAVVGAIIFERCSTNLSCAVDVLNELAQVKLYSPVLYSTVQLYCTLLYLSAEMQKQQIFVGTAKQGGGGG